MTVVVTTGCLVPKTRETWSRTPEEHRLSTRPSGALSLCTLVAKRSMTKHADALGLVDRNDSMGPPSRFWRAMAGF